MSMTAHSTTEETPLLVNETQDVYSRFSFLEKQSILLIISFSGLLTCACPKPGSGTKFWLRSVDSFCWWCLCAYHRCRCQRPSCQSRGGQVSLEYNPPHLTKPTVYSWTVAIY